MNNTDLIIQPGQVYQNVSLKSFNTFGIPAVASHFAIFQSDGQFRQLLKSCPVRPIYILGGGSNILLTSARIDGLVLLNQVKEIQIIRSYSQHALVAAGAGESWHGLVQWALQHNLGGIENLSLIPGTVGAAPMQNIGAYGVELKDVFAKLEAINIQNGHKKVFFSHQCAFGYRESIFKHQFKDQYCITRVYLNLTTQQHHLRLQYGDIQKILAEKQILHPTIHDVSEAVIAIRQSKLPDPAVLGNAGSFFKNPVIAVSHFNKLQVIFPDLPSYPAGDGFVKVPAGWLIEKTGWKGKKVGETGAHAKQALVLVNYGNASGDEIYNLALQIMDAVQKTFGISIQPEVNIW